MLTVAPIPGEDRGLGLIHPYVSRDATKAWTLTSFISFERSFSKESSVDVKDTQSFQKPLAKECTLSHIENPLMI